MAKGSGHLPVLCREVVRLLEPASKGVVLDGTFGGGGHSRAILKSYPELRLIGLDCDPQACERAKEFEKEFGDRFQFFDTNFVDLDGLDLPALDGVLFDFGVSSFQLDQAERGFSFRKPAPLDMRLDPRRGESAAEFLETADRESLIKAIRVYGEEKSWRRIVDAVEGARGTGKLQQTNLLAELIHDALPAAVKRGMKIHPATKAFQGIRIAVNAELDVIEQGLPKAFEQLAPGGVLAAISFHSLEDRITKRYFRTLCGQPVDRRDNRSQQDREVFAEALTRKPISPSSDELELNPRSRSSKLRAVRKLTNDSN